MPATDQGRATGPVEPADELTSLSARRVAALVAAGTVTAQDVVAAHLLRVARHDGDLHALVHVDAHGALAAAARVDADVLAGRPVGPLAGVPVVVKDNLDVHGQVTAAGSRAHTGAVALRDAAAVARLAAAGAVVLGRANTDELAMGASTHTSAHGPTRNPWDPDRSPGGSSGGSAAAVAAGLATAALGTDTGGSVREPAAQCGVVGLAPTPGLVPLAGAVPFAAGFDRVGPLTRTVDDAALLLAVLADRPRLAGAVHPSGLRRLRVGLVTELAGPPNRPGVLAGLDRAVDDLAAAGVDVIPVSVPDAPAALAAYMTLTSAACVDVLAPWVATGRAGDEVVRRVALGRRLREDGTELAAARDVRRRLIRQTTRALRACDVLLSPTLPTTAPVVTGHRDADRLTDPMLAPYTDCWTVVANLTALPSLSVPVGLAPDDGMPVGALLTGRAGADAGLLALGGLIERSCAVPPVDPATPCHEDRCPCGSK